MLEELRADLARYPGNSRTRLWIALRCPGFYAVALYRVRADIYQRWPSALALPAKLALAPVSLALGWALGISLKPKARIGPGLYIGHWGGIRVGSQVVLGKDCNLSPGVVIGGGLLGQSRGEPTLGDRVYVAAGAKVFGPIRVGSDVAIGANAVVCRDVPEHVSVGGVPARIISRRGSAPHLPVGQPLDPRDGADGAEASPPPAASEPVSPRLVEVPELDGEQSA